jgi:Ni/Co efflux regulator RcnB
VKKTICAILAASIAFTPVIASAASAAQHRDRDRHDQRGPQQNNWKKWRKGDRFDNRRARYYQQIDYRKYRGLRAPPRGYRWVRSDNDAVLVAITTGVIASVIAGAVR